MARLGKIEHRTVDGRLQSRRLDKHGNTIADWKWRFCNKERAERPTRFCHKVAVGLDAEGRPMCDLHIQT